jgi:hypothetical protein
MDQNFPCRACLDLTSLLALLGSPPPVTRSVVWARAAVVYEIPGGAVLYGHSISLEMNRHQQLGIAGSDNKMQILGYATTGDATPS